jgi:Holliday junction resolvase-like predicted endonuclease
MPDPHLTHAQGAPGLCVAAVVLAPGVALGRAGEDAAAAHLTQRHGLELVARNWRVALDELRGELDLVAQDPRSGMLVVCEVKSRSRATSRDGAAAALGLRQQARIRRLTALLLASGEIRAPRVRFDLVALDRLGDPPCATVRLTHLSDAW